MTGCPLLDSECAARQNGKRLPCERLAEENERLRELVRDMGAAFIHGPCYRWCEFKEPCNGDRCQYRDRMRELGVDA